MTTMRERIAKALFTSAISEVDGEPIEWVGALQTTRDKFMRHADKVLDELMQPSDEMVNTIVGGMLKPLSAVTREMAFNSWQAAIRAAKEGK